jgi:hypothetical protein
VGCSLLYKKIPYIRISVSTAARISISIFINGDKIKLIDNQKMSELPFTIEQFLELFEVYNRSIWPSQLIAYLLGVIALILIIRNKPRSDSFINVILGTFWIWMGAVYHILFFSSINPAATIFGSLFILQGILFIVLNLTGLKLQFAFRKDLYGLIGDLYILYAMIGYPLLGHALGHIYPQSPVFGVTPCPTTIFTFGLLLLTKGRMPYWLLIIPGLWALIGFSAAVQLTIYEDMGLVIAGVTGVILLVFRNFKQVYNPAYILNPAHLTSPGTETKQ